MGCTKKGVKKQGHCYLKRGKAAWPLLFLNNNDPVFSPCFFQVHIWTCFFQGHTLTHVFKTRIVGAD